MLQGLQKADEAQDTADPHLKYHAGEHMLYNWRLRTRQRNQILDAVLRLLEIGSFHPLLHQQYPEPQVVLWEHLVADANRQVAKGVLVHEKRFPLLFADSLQRMEAHQGASAILPVSIERRGAS